MDNSKYLTWRIIAVFIAFACFLSCNNSVDVPFPKKELGTTQPVAMPFVFSAPKKLNWDTVRSGRISPVVKKLDIDALPSRPFDSTGFKPFAEPPAEVKFNFNHLPEKNFSLDKLPSKSLEFKTSLLAPAAIVKAGKPSPQRGKPLSIFDFNQIQGLQAKFIGALFLDHKGLLWIGSTEGLFRYDGERIQTFIQGSPTFATIGGIIEDKAGNIWFVQSGGTNIGVIHINEGTISYSEKIAAVNNNITRFTLDEKGNIWLYNTKDKAISIIDPAAGTYKNIDIKAGLSDSTGAQIVQDNDKNIWITTATHGVNIIDVASGKIKYLEKSSGLSNDSLMAIAVDEKGIIWIAEPNGLNAIDTKKGMIKIYNQSQGFKQAFTLDLYFDSKGRLWKNTANGIELSDPENQTIRYIDQADGLSGSVVTAVVTDSYSRMWVGTTTGLNIIDQNGETVHPFSNTSIICLTEDDAGNLWIGTQKGLYIVDAKRTTMRLLNRSNGLTNDFVQSFWKKNGKLVIATNGGFNIFDPVNKTLSSAGKKEGLVSDSIYAAFNDRSGKIWLTGPSNGIDKIDSANNIILHTDVSGGLNDNSILDIKQDKDGMVWLATRTNGINIIDPATGTVKYLNNQPGLRDTCVRMMVEDEYGRMWIGTDKGIYVADKKNGTLTNITTRHGLTNNVVLSLLEYNGSVLAGTSAKITVIKAPPPDDSTKDWEISVLNKSGGIVKQTTSWSTDAITKAGEYLWGDIGITVINEINAKKDSGVTYITGMTAMTEPERFINGQGLSKNDTLWTADTFYVKGRKLPDLGYANKNTLEWDSVTGPYNMPVNLSIPYDKNYLQFQFARASLGAEDTVWYTYILEGIDKSWSEVTVNSYTENYLNLPPGKYALKVSSKGNNGKWETPAVFRFTISPPWYQTWWAYTLFALIGIGLLRIYVVYRSRKLQKTNRLLEQKVTERTLQLEQSLDELKAAQSQLIQSEKMASLGDLTAGIAHEIQNPLNFVNNFSEVNAELTDELKEELDKTKLSAEERLPIDRITDDIKSNEEKINFHGKRADSIVKGMLQHSRNSNGQRELTDINQLADEYLRLAFHGLRAKDKSFNANMKTDFDPRVGSLNVVPQDLGRVFLNLITNAFYAVAEKNKQANGNYEPTVFVSTKKMESKVEIVVKDNGNGIPQKVIDKIFQPFFTTKPTGQGTGLGLSLSYDIVKAHGGEIKVNSNENTGAEFVVSLPS